MCAARPTLGVVAICYNEEQDLPGFLANLDPWVDEIVLVDDGSSDRTEEIATAFGAKVKFLQTPREEGEYFSHQRNKGIDAAQSDWLLHLDIDERATPALAGEILAAIARPEMSAYRYRRLNYFMHRPMQGGNWNGWNLVHLARRSALRFGGMYHEDCNLSVPDSEVGQLENKMHHFNEDRFEKRLRKSNTYLEETALAIEKRGKQVAFRDIALRPAAEFIRNYILRRGFRDGIPGLISAAHSATATFRAHALVWDRQNGVDRGALETQISADWAASNFTRDTR